METCDQSGYVFRDFCFKQGIDFYQWLRGTKKFCCMSGGQQVNEAERGIEDEEAVAETSLHVSS